MTWPFSNSTVTVPKPSVMSASGSMMVSRSVLRRWLARVAMPARLGPVLEVVAKWSVV